MNMISFLKKIKNSLYLAKEEAKMIFTYPKWNGSYSIDHDSYWQNKRGDNIGALSSWQKERADYILSKIKKFNDLKIVDVGCGSGNILAYIKSHKNDTEIIGIDGSRSALQIANNLGVKTIHTDDLVGSINSTSDVDFFLFLEILEHMRNPEKVLKTALSLSKRGVIFSVPNTGFITHRMRLFFGKFPMQWREFPGEHLRFWTLKDMNWWLSHLNIKNYKIHTYKGIPILNKILPSIFSAGIIISIVRNE